MSHLEILSYKCDYCGSTFRHHQLFEDEVIKCPSCGASKVKIVDQVSITQTPEGEIHYEENTTIEDINFGIHLITIIIFLGVFLIVVTAILPGVIIRLATASLTSVNPVVLSMFTTIMPIIMMITIFVVFFGIYKNYT